MTAEEEIEAGLKNAVERGVPLDKAVQTFINAGYSESSVKSAAHAVSDMPISSQLVSAPKGDLPVSKLEDKKIEYKPTAMEAAAAQQQMLPTVSSPSTQIEQKKIESAPANSNDGVSKTKIIILVAILVLLLIVLGASLIFRDQILAMLA